jgi:hypothetical protein
MPQKSGKYKSSFDKMKVIYTDIYINHCVISFDKGKGNHRAEATCSIEALKRYIRRPN